MSLKPCPRMHRHDGAAVIFHYPSIAALRVLFTYSLEFEFRAFFVLRRRATMHTYDTANDV